MKGVSVLRAAWANRRLGWLACLTVWLVASTSAASDSNHTINPDALHRAFETSPEAPWIVATAAGASRSRILSTTASDAWDLRDCRALSVSAALGSGVAGFVRLRWHVTSRLGGEYQTLAAVDLPSGTHVTVQVNAILGAQSNLVPVGHLRPWDALAASAVLSLELRAEHSLRKDSPSISLSSAALQPRGNIENDKPPILCDISLAPAPSTYRAAAVLSFRIDPMPADPYSPDGEGDVRVSLHSGKKYPAFLDQALLLRREGSVRRALPQALPRWCVYLPEMPSQGSIEIASGTRKWQITAASLAALTKPAVVFPGDIDNSGSLPLERWHAALEAASDLHTRVHGGPLQFWQMSSLPPVKDLPGWEPLRDDQTGAHSAQLLKETPTVWRPVPFWNAGWGGFAGLRYPENSLARQMDILLENASAAGESKPLAILDGESFELHGDFNWESHPLHGLLREPSELFRHPRGLSFLRRGMRYAIARWGFSKAVSGLWITSGMLDPDSADLHTKLAASVREWLPDENLPVLTLNPLARPPSVIAQLSSFKNVEIDSPNHWSADTRISPAIGTPVKLPDGRIAFEVRARDAATRQIGLSGTFMLGVPEEIAQADTLLFDVWMPPESPPDLRIGVHLCDRDANWYETLLPGMATPGEWCTYALDLTARNADKLAPADGKNLPWPEAARQSLTEIGIHVYCAHLNWWPKGKNAETLSARFANIKAVRFSRDPAMPEITEVKAESFQRTAALSSFEADESRSPIVWSEDQTGEQIFQAKDTFTDGSLSLEVRASGVALKSIGITGALTRQRYEYRKPAPDDLSPAEILLFDVLLPASAPPDIRVGVHLRDCDELWFQTLLPVMAKPGEWMTYALDLTGANFNSLKGVGHKKAWTDYSRRRIREIGLHVFSAHEGWKKGETTAPIRARFDNVRLAKSLRKPAPPTAAIALTEPARVGQALARGELWECHFKTARTFANPFDPTECDLSAAITTPSGKTVRVAAFFDQRCERREATARGDEIVEAVGEEFFTVRYRPLENGPYTVTLELREGGKYQEERDDGDGQQIHFIPGAVTASLPLPTPAFAVSMDAIKDPNAKPFHGFVRAAADKRHLEFDDGTFYYPMGPCLRSPSDNRVAYYGWNVEKSEPLSRRGTYQYDEYFAQFEKAGMNWARVWMSPWWGGLEWRRDWPGFQGAGRYSLTNAWRVDHLLAEAERRGVLMTLCLTNHGQFSNHVDAEWDDNPYNVDQGGPLESPQELFSTARGRILHQNKLRYVVARFGHSPAIMEWSLFSELEWTQGSDSTKNNWHSAMASYLKEIDPNKHLVSTHFSHPMRGGSTLAVPEIDVAASNAYSVFRELGNGACDASAALADFWAGNEHLPGFQSYHKPALVEEQGRHFMGNNTKEQLNADLHAGLWGGMVQPLAGTTGYWWWLHLHLDNRYSEYRALANFMQGEDMRPAKDETMLEPFFRAVRTTTSAEGTLLGRALKSDRRIYIWIYHHDTPLGQEVPDVADGILKVGGLNPGEYTVEFWDTYAGTVIEKQERTVKLADGKSTSIEVAIPVVKRDVAVKVKRK